MVLSVIGLKSLIVLLPVENMGRNTRKPVFRVCEQQRISLRGMRRLVCASAQTDQRLFIHILDSIISKLATSKLSIF